MTYFQFSKVQPKTKNRARGIPRNIALRRVLKKKEDRRPVIALTYDPRMPPIQTIQEKHWRSMVSQDPYLAEVYQQPPLTAFRRQRNLKDQNATKIVQLVLL